MDMAEKSPRPKSRQDEALLLAADAAAALCSVSVRQWWRWDSAGQTPRAVHIGTTKRWRREELVEWIRAGCPGRQEWEQVRMLPPVSMRRKMTVGLGSSPKRKLAAAS